MPPPDGGPRPLPALVISSLLLAGCHVPAPVPDDQAPVQVAAASDLSLAFEELGKLFERRTGRKVTLSFAASGALARQLGQGAPFDVFAAANASFVDSAVKAGACDGASKLRYARGHLVAWSKAGGVKLGALSELRRPQVERIAIANPEHAPYGQAAREALLRAGLWHALEHKLVQAENVRQALQFAKTGNADVALVALSLVADDTRGHTFAIDPDLHAPIEHTLVVCRRGKNEAGGRELAKLVESAEGKAVLRRFGFGASDE